MKEIKFSTPVAMRATQEQYREDLKEQLKEIGYNVPDFINGIIYTNWKDKRDVGSSINVSHNNLLKSKFINHYNPKLFLALSSMTEDKEDRVSTTWMFNKETNLLDNELFSSGNYINNPIWRKATIEEIVNHFTNKTMNKFKKGDKVSIPNSDKKYKNSMGDYYSGYNLDDVREIIEVKEDLIRFFGDINSWFYAKDFEKNEDFILPEKWYIKDCKEVSEYAYKKNGSDKTVSNLYYHNLADSKVYTSSVFKLQPLESHTEITLEQFKKYVLMEEEYKEDIKEFPKYVVTAMLDEQERQGNKRDVNVFKKDKCLNDFQGGFSWAKSLKGYNFWYSVITDRKFHLLKDMDRFPFTLKEEDAKRIINIACEEWKSILAKKWGQDLLLNDKVKISEHYYNEMRKACTSEQIELFDSIFGKDEVFIPDGTPCLVRDSNINGWEFRYADGKGEFYNDSRKEGESSNWEYVKVLDIDNLPIND